VADSIATLDVEVVSPTTCECRRFAFPVDCAVSQAAAWAAEAFGLPVSKGPKPGEPWGYYDRSRMYALLPQLDPDREVSLADLGQRLDHFSTDGDRLYLVWLRGEFPQEDGPPEVPAAPEAQLELEPSKVLTPRGWEKVDALTSGGLLTSAAPTA